MNLLLSSILKENGIEATVFPHKSHNNHFKGSIVGSGKIVFIKVFRDQSLFINEKKILTQYLAKELICHFNYQTFYFLITPFKNYFEIDFDQEGVIEEAGSLIANFHNKHSNFISRKDRINLSPPSERIYKLLNNMKTHYKINQISSHFNVIKHKLSSLDKEFMNKESIKFIHGDFGSRNIKRHNNKFELIDFERSRLDNVWVEFIKLFELDLCDKKKINIFKWSYERVSFLPIISKDLYYLLVFIEVISIYDYTSLNRDPKFEKKADMLLEKLKVIYN
ncbi:hypothetical protein [Bacillus thuringiensis]|uniref:Aminoglycoside phosphotransferase domain-containing protein n=1 Tax=Bacillus thuringiensis TaxID=1428 RepID=A0AAW9J1Z2_BACTU|nr:hypothetical protein [Bacillus thuringiensis]MDZ5475617.1 hypothetical protein [Bacillus thuringiensis]MRB33269.1 hypothetical protein [Bacillus thuringiensis]